MFDRLEPRYTRLLASSVVSIGLFLFLAMLYVALGNPAAVTGIAFKMFLAGIVCGVIISAFGLILYFTAKDTPTEST